MEIMKSEASWECKNVLETIPITNKLNCYRLTKYVNGSIVSVDEGFTYDTKVEVNKEINEKGRMMFCKYDIVDFNLYTPFGFYGADYDVQKEFIIEKPFTFLLSCPNYDYGQTAIFIEYKVNEGRLMNLDGDYLPQGIVFNDITGVDNEYYDLDEILKVIENHPQIKMLADGKQPIPWYNASETCTHYLKFMYIPTQEEFNEAIKSKKDLHHFALERLDLLKYRKED